MYTRQRHARQPSKRVTIVIIVVFRWCIASTSCYPALLIFGPELKADFDYKDLDLGAGLLQRIN